MTIETPARFGAPTNRLTIPNAGALRWHRRIGSPPAAAVYTGALRGAGGVAHGAVRGLFSAAVKARLPAAASTGRRGHRTQRTIDHEPIRVRKIKPTVQEFYTGSRAARYPTRRRGAPREHARLTKVNRVNDRWKQQTVVHLKLIRVSK